MSSPTLPVGSLILVTGVTGLVGSHVARELLERGYKVRGSTRDAGRAQDLKVKFEAKFGNGSFEVVEIKDFTEPKAYIEALKGASGLVHVATDVSFSTDTKTVVDAAVGGTIAALEASAATPSVMRFVLTSSRIAVYNAEAGQTLNVTSEDWFDAVVPLASATPADDPNKAVLTYAASKVAAERAAWEYVKNNNVHFGFNTVLPDLVIGEVLNTASLSAGSTSGMVQSAYKGDPSMLLLFASVPHHFIDVRDVARLHVGALLEPDIVNSRIWADAGEYTVNGLLSAFRTLRPDHKVIDDITNLPQAPKITVDQPVSLEILKRQGRSGYISLKDAVEATLIGV